jgi:hypothetical protein
MVGYKISEGHPACISTLKMAVTWSSETMVSYHMTTLHDILKELNSSPSSPYPSAIPVPVQNVLHIKLVSIL